MEYRQLTQNQRYQIHARYDLGMSQRQIGRVILPSDSGHPIKEAH